MLDKNRLWDGKVKSIQVTGARHDCMEVRVLVSAANSSVGWDLRCELRERLIDFVQRSYPQGFPLVRTEFIAATPAVIESRPPFIDPRP